MGAVLEGLVWNFVAWQHLDMPADDRPNLQWLKWEKAPSYWIISLTKLW